MSKLIIDLSKQIKYPDKDLVEVAITALSKDKRFEGRCYDCGMLCSVLAQDKTDNTKNFKDCWAPNFIIEREQVIFENRGRSA